MPIRDGSEEEAAGPEPRTEDTRPDLCWEGNDTPKVLLTKNDRGWYNRANGEQGCALFSLK